LSYINNIHEIFQLALKPFVVIGVAIALRASPRTVPFLSSPSCAR
jgi:hypothetical protein